MEIRQNEKKDAAGRLFLLLTMDSNGSTVVLPLQEALLEWENSPKRKEGCLWQTSFVVDKGNGKVRKLEWLSKKWATWIYNNQKWI